MKFKYTSLLIVAAALLVSSCKKSQTVFPDPYADSKAPLGIVTDPQQVPVPASGGSGTVVSITATGLLPYKDKLQFLFNGQMATIKSITATGIEVVVPDNASTGITAFVVDGQLVFGPQFIVVGKVALDPTYNNPVGALGGAVLNAFQVPQSTQWIIMGGFTNYANAGVVRPTYRIVRAFQDGSWDRSFQVGAGANSDVYDMAQVGPYYYIVGAFSGYAQQNGGVSGIAKITTNGLIDTVAVTTYLKKVRYVPTFNGGVAGGRITSIYPDGNNKMIVTGDFTYYTSRVYNQNTYDYKDSTIIDSTVCNRIARIKDNGYLDSTWRFDKNAPGYKGTLGASLPGPNGPIQSVQDEKGSILIYGQFTSFDGVPKNSIVRITADGKIDDSFTSGGTTQNIARVSYNATLKKYLVVGSFLTFDNKPIPYMVQLNYDGSVDESFTAKTFDGGVPTFVKLLNDGLAVVNGTFRSYDGVIRNGFAVINPTGALASGYNSIGNVSGSIYNVYETTSADNKRALLIMGSFNLFDNQPKNNIVRVTFQ